MKETLNEIYEKMSKGLYLPLIFYFPRRIWKQFDKNRSDDKMFDDAFDNVALIKTDGLYALLNNELSNSYFFIKKERLDKNTFKLMDLQKDLNEKQFKFLLDKYCNQLDFCRKISMWMVQNVQKDITDLSKETLRSFELQQNSFNEHWKYVQENFEDAPKMEEATTESILSKNDFKNFQDLIKPAGILSGSINTTRDKEEEVKTPKKPKKEKKILVTEEEATTFLLRTVFNLDL